MAIWIVMVQTGQSNEHLLETATQKTVATTAKTDVTFTSAVVR
jgi:hypothetical protein